MRVSKFSCFILLCEKNHDHIVVIDLYDLLFRLKNELLYTVFEHNIQSPVVHWGEEVKGESSSPHHLLLPIITVITGTGG